MGHAVEIKLKQLMEEYNLTQRETAIKTGLSQRTISDLCSNKMERIPKTALTKIGEAFAIEDIRDLIDFNKEE